MLSVLGDGVFSESTLLKVYKSGCRGSAIYNQLLRWRLAGGRVNQCLINRRKKEWYIFSGSNVKVGGYNCSPEISYVDTNGNDTNQVVTANNGYGANPY